MPAERSKKTRTPQERSIDPAAQEHAGPRRRARHLDGLQSGRADGALPDRRRRYVLPGVLHGPLPPGQRRTDGRLRRDGRDDHRPQLRPRRRRRRRRPLRSRPRPGLHAAGRRQGRGAGLHDPRPAQVDEAGPASWASRPRAVPSATSPSTSARRASTSSANRRGEIFPTPAAPRPSARNCGASTSSSRAASTARSSTSCTAPTWATTRTPSTSCDQAMRTALADGWGGSMIATDLSDILFGTPSPLVSQVNLGVLKDDEVNIVVHGHEPTLSEMILAATSDPELIEYAQTKGAQGINLAGICCTTNETLMRQGMPSAGNFLHQELAMLTGAVEAMVVDVQCIMQALPNLAEQLPHRDHHHLAQGEDHRRDPHRVRRTPRAGHRQGDRAAGDRQLSRTAAKSTSPTSEQTSCRASRTSTSTTCWAAATALPSAR